MKCLLDPGFVSHMKPDWLHQALTIYAQSLEAAQASGDELQIMYDLWGVATSLTALREDPQTLEVAGIAEAQSREIRGYATHRQLEVPDASNPKDPDAPWRHLRESTRSRLLSGASDPASQPSARRVDTPCPPPAA